MKTFHGTLEQLADQLPLKFFTKLYKHCEEMRVPEDRVMTLYINVEFLNSHV